MHTLRLHRFMYRTTYFEPFIELDQSAKLIFTLIAVRTMQASLRGRRDIGIRPLSKEHFGKVRRIGDQREQRINVGVEGKTPEVVLVGQDSGERSKRGDPGCLAGHIK